MGLKKYREKRNLTVSKEPLPEIKKSPHQLRFCIQEHDARRLHYDLRLEVNGVLKSWAVPKKPSLDPREKRLAIMVEDHPYDYQFFEGIISEGYGKGSVTIWDQGTYGVKDSEGKAAEKEMVSGLKKGELHFSLQGKKLRGEFVLTKLKQSEKGNEWLLIKKRDRYAKEIGEDKQKQFSPKKMPKRIKPMLYTTMGQPFDDPAWLFEIAWNGYRTIARVDKQEVSLSGLNNISFNQSFPSLLESLKRLNVEAIFDGTIVFLDKKGISHFPTFIEDARGGSLIYYISDLLFLNGRDLRSLPLIQRKKFLFSLLKSASADLRFVDHIEGRGKEFSQLAFKKGIEGIFAKRSYSKYISRSSHHFLKIPLKPILTTVICGYIEESRRIKYIILGIYKNSTLTLWGRVEIPSRKMSNPLKELLDALPGRKKQGSTVKIKPHYLCDIEMTSENEPIFLRIREDISPKKITMQESFPA